MILYLPAPKEKRRYPMDNMCSKLFELALGFENEPTPKIVFGDNVNEVTIEFYDGSCLFAEWNGKMWCIAEDGADIAYRSAIDSACGY